MANKEDSPLVKGLKEYFENTPQEQLDKDFQAIEKYNHIGPDVLEYFEHIEDEARRIFRRECTFNRDGLCTTNMESGSIKKCTAFTDCDKIAEYDRIHTCLPNKESLDNVYRYIKTIKN